MKPLSARFGSEDGKYGDVELDQIERTRDDLNAIILGTFHAYKTN
jgi:hypothetical protein